MPVFGISASGLDADQPDWDVPELAAHYVSWVREVQPEGPYRLGGWSSGGTLAYEMARQLIAAGAHVEFLALIDTRVSYHEPPLPSASQEDAGAGMLAAVWVQAAEPMLLSRHLMTSRWLDRALRAYQPEGLPMPVYLFNAATRESAEATAGWREVLGAGLHEAVIGGSHQTLVRDPLVARLAAAIAGALEARRRASRPTANR
jgi:thioesterase domain-containing protein